MSLTSLIAFTYNGSTFGVEACDTNEDPIVEPQIGRTGTKATVTATIFVDGTGPADLEAKIAAAYAALVSGKDLLLAGIGGTTLYAIPAARCKDQGPHLKIKGMPHARLPLRYAFVVTAEAETIGGPDGDGSGGGGGNAVSERAKITTRERPDRLWELVKSGKVIGVGAATHFVATTMPAWEAAWPLPNWVTEAQYTVNGSGNASEAEFTLTAVEMFTPLPATANNDAIAVEGSYQLSEARDEQFRKVITRTWDLLVDGDISKMLNLIRPLPPAIILTESVTSERIKENRLRATFVVVTSADVTKLMNYRQRVTITRGEPIVEEKTYAGAEPLLVRTPKRVSRIVQEGRAVVEGPKYYDPAAKAIYPTQLVELPVIAYEQLNPAENETTWRFVMARLPGQSLPNVLSAGRDTDPKFL